MRNAKLLLFPLATAALAVTVALVLTWLTATPDERDEMSQWASERIGREAPDEDARQIDWDALPPEIIAWVEVPGAAIDEPIVQADPEHPDYYLYADVFGEGGLGTPYIDCDCSLGGPLTIIYGHHMDDGGVFADFARFSDRDYAMGHREIVVYLREGNRKVELDTIAVDIVNANRETLRAEFDDQDEFEAYARKAIEESDLVLESPQDVGRLYAFSTCSYQTGNSRTVVYAIEKEGSL
ncbi:MAG: class B sortase [Eggerthellaceae bacterium]|nr:class B sortase [Eggerthellaceae bacterium]